MIDLAASAIAVLTGAYFIWLAGLACFAPERAIRFLGAFAGSARAHYLELGARLLVGGSFLLAAPRMLFPAAFTGFGWMLLVTTAPLLAIPWRWHQRIASRAVPMATRHLRLFALASLLIGCFVLSAFGFGAAQGP